MFDSRQYLSKFVTGVPVGHSRSAGTYAPNIRSCLMRILTSSHGALFRSAGKSLELSNETVWVHSKSNGDDWHPSGDSKSYFMVGPLALAKFFCQQRDKPIHARQGIFDLILPCFRRLDIDMRDKQDTPNDSRRSFRSKVSFLTSDLWLRNRRKACLSPQIRLAASTETVLSPGTSRPNSFSTLHLRQYRLQEIRRR